MQLLRAAKFQIEKKLHREGDPTGSAVGLRSTTTGPTREKKAALPTDGVTADQVVQPRNEVSAAHDSGKSREGEVVGGGARIRELGDAVEIDQAIDRAMRARFRRGKALLKVAARDDLHGSNFQKLVDVTAGSQHATSVVEAIADRAPFETLIWGLRALSDKGRVPALLVAIERGDLDAEAITALLTLGASTRDQQNRNTILNVLIGKTSTKAMAQIVGGLEGDEHVTRMVHDALVALATGTLQRGDAAAIAQACVSSGNRSFEPLIQMRERTDLEPGEFDAAMRPLAGIADPEERARAIAIFAPVASPSTTLGMLAQLPADHTPPVLRALTQSEDLTSMQARTVANAAARLGEPDFHAEIVEALIGVLTPEQVLAEVASIDLKHEDGESNRDRLLTELHEARDLTPAQANATVEAAAVYRAPLDQSALIEESLAEMKLDDVIAAISAIPLSKKDWDGHEARADVLKALADGTLCKGQSTVNVEGVIAALELLPGKNCGEYRTAVLGKLADLEGLTAGDIRAILTRATQEKHADIDSLVDTALTGVKLPVVFAALEDMPDEVIARGAQILAWRDDLDDGQIIKAADLTDFIGGTDELTDALVSLTEYEELSAAAAATIWAAAERLTDGDCTNKVLDELMPLAPALTVAEIIERIPASLKDSDGDRVAVNALRIATDRGDLDAEAANAFAPLTRLAKDPETQGELLQNLAWVADTDVVLDAAEKIKIRKADTSGEEARNDLVHKLIDVCDEHEESSNIIARRAAIVGDTELLAEALTSVSGQAGLEAVLDGVKELAKLEKKSGTNKAKDVLVELAERYEDDATACQLIADQAHLAGGPHDAREVIEAVTGAAPLPWLLDAMERMTGDAKKVRKARKETFMYLIDNLDLTGPQASKIMESAGRLKLWNPVLGLLPRELVIDGGFKRKTKASK